MFRAVSLPSLCVLLGLLAFAAPSTAQASTGVFEFDIDRSLPTLLQTAQVSDDDFGPLPDEDPEFAELTTRELHKNAKWRYWIGFPSFFSGLGFWTLSGSNVAGGNPIGGIPTAVLGSVGFSVGLAFILKAQRYDNAATDRIRGSSLGARDSLRARRRLHGFQFTSGSIASR